MLILLLLPIIFIIWIILKSASIYDELEESQENNPINQKKSVNLTLLKKYDIIYEVDGTLF